LIHIIGDDGDIEVWLDTEVAACDGLCIGHAATRDAAIADARDTLHGALTELDAAMVDPVET
jgi:hypothetical protein